MTEPWTNWNDIVLGVDDFNVDDTVVYVPKQHQHNIRSQDLQYGVVTSKNNRFVFVKFKYKVHSHPCEPNDLRIQL